jgi:hypothetical protein
MSLACRGQAGALPASGEAACSLETCVWGKTDWGGIASGPGGCKC